MSEIDRDSMDPTRLPKDPTTLRWPAVGVRVSTPLRRGAAPYADGCEQIYGHSHLISLLPLSEGERFEGGILTQNSEYDTMAPLPQRAPLVLTHSH